MRVMAPRPARAQSRLEDQLKPAFAGKSAAAKARLEKEREMVLMQNKVQRALARRGLTLRTGFERLDADSSGSVDTEEFISGIRDLDASIPHEGLLELMAVADADGSGETRSI